LPDGYARRMADADRLVDEAVTIASMARQYVKTDPTYREPGQMISHRSSESTSQHADLAQDLLDEIQGWEERVREARANGTLRP
jgi:hypothetical protein